MRPFLALPLIPLFATISLFASPARAYLPPSHFLIDAIARKHASLGKPVRLASTLAAGDASVSVVTLIDAQARVARTVLLPRGGTEELARVERRGTWPLALALLFEKDAAELGAALKAEGVPVVAESELVEMSDEEERRAAETEWLGRFERRLAWVIGPRDPLRSQLWIEKDAFFPARFFFKGKGGRMELRYEAFKVSRDIPYPRAQSLVARDGGNLLAREEFLELAYASAAEVAELGAASGDGRGGVKWTPAGESLESAARAALETYLTHAR